MSRNRNPKTCLSRRVSLSCENTESCTRISKHLTLLRETVDTMPPLKKERGSQSIPARRNKIPKAISRKRSLGREEHGTIAKTPTLPFKRNLDDDWAKNMSNSEICWVAESFLLSCENSQARTRQSKH
jgi:hypothetical protein